tara:strand:- start:61 stop:234 length:174 start_codon:yes stop_codon:yes gene_type:complete
MSLDERRLLFELLIRHRGILENQMLRSKNPDKLLEEIELINSAMLSLTKLKVKDHSS